MCVLLCSFYSINDNESCADLLLERMDSVSVNSVDKAGRYTCTKQTCMYMYIEGSYALSVVHVAISIFCG